MGTLKDLNDSKLIVWVQVIPLIIQDQFYTIQYLQRSPILQTSNLSGLCFAVSYNKPGSSISKLKTGHLFNIKIHFLPLSTTTSRIFRSRFTFLPTHFLQRSLGSIRSPVPWHSPHIDWICCIMPGPNCWTRTCIPEPRQLGHLWTAPSLPPMPEKKNNNTLFEQVQWRFRWVFKKLYISHVSVCKMSSRLKFKSCSREIFFWKIDSFRRKC